MFAFAAAAYLRRTKGVTIERIVYGAYEARDPFRTPPQPGDRAPVFDLRPLLDLLDWLEGAEFLLRRNDATLLAERLRGVQRRARQRHRSDDLPRHLQTVATKLQVLSQALQLGRPRDVMRHAHELLPLLDEAASEVGRWAKPFAVILERVRSEAARLAHHAPDHLDEEHLRGQLALIEDFLNKGMLVQAVLLAREWLVSWVALQRAEGDWLDRDHREREVEGALGAAARRLREPNAAVPEWFGRIPSGGEAARAWNRITQLRNDLAHCGMRRDAASLQSIDQQANEIPARLHGLLSGAPDR